MIYLIRHGETEWNRERRVMGRGPIPLNERGRRAVTELARRLSGEGIGTVYTSTVARAMETARILAGSWNAEIREMPGLDESSYESWVGRGLEELGSEEQFRLYMEDPESSDFSSGEGMTDIQARALGAVKAIAEGAGNGRAAAVSHSDVIKPILAHYLGMDLGAMHRLSIANASVTLLELGGAGPRVRYMNVVPWRWR